MSPPPPRPRMSPHAPRALPQQQGSLLVVLLLAAIAVVRRPPSTAAPRDGGGGGGGCRRPRLAACPALGDHLVATTKGSPTLGRKQTSASTASTCPRSSQRHSGTARSSACCRGPPLLLASQRPATDAPSAVHVKHPSPRQRASPRALQPPPLQHGRLVVVLVLVDVAVRVRHPQPPLLVPAMAAAAAAADTVGGVHCRGRPPRDGGHRSTAIRRDQPPTGRHVLPPPPPPRRARQPPRPGRRRCSTVGLSSCWC